MRIKRPDVKHGRRSFWRATEFEAREGSRVARLEALEERSLLAVTASMVADIDNATTGSPSISNLVVAGNQTFFIANDGVHGSELWVSDGQASGTRLTRDVTEATLSSLRPLSPGISNLTAVGNIVYFTVNFTYATGFNFHTVRGLWRSDGTTAGTFAVPSFSSAASNLFNFGGTLFFRTSTNNGAGEELYKYDPVGGVTLVKDLVPGTGSSSVANFTEFNGVLYFSALSGANQGGIWRTDGTSAGTYMVSPVFSSTSGSWTGLKFVSDGGLFFSVTQNGQSQLWKTDGTPGGGQPVANVQAGEMVDVNGTLFFTGSNETGNSLWRSDGTSAGTYPIAAVSASQLTNADGQLFFSGNDGSGSVLWKSDGTPGGTVAVSASTLSPSGITALGNKVLFSFIVPGVGGRKLGISDGAEAGTGLLVDYDPLNGISPSNFTRVGNRIYFTATTVANGTELYLTDGNAAGTTLLEAWPGAGSANPNNLTSVNGMLLFTADDPVHDRELWSTIGTPAGTGFVFDINARPVGSDPSQFQPLGSGVAFIARDPIHGAELWKIDSSAPEGALIADIKPGDQSAFAPQNAPSSVLANSLASTGSQLLMFADDGVHGRELWSSDGTSAGTGLIYEFDQNPLTPGGWGTLNDRAIFSTASGLYSSDGTPEGTVLIDATATNGFLFTRIGNWLYFIAHSSWLYRTDGTTATLIRGGVSSASNFVEYGGSIYFVSTNSANGREVWKTDGTFAGTQLAFDLLPGSGSSNPRLAVASGKLMILANPGIDTLYAYDGANLAVVSSGGLNVRASGPFGAASGLVYFSDSSNDLWRSDGTPAGTQQIKSMSSIGNFVTSGGRLYFAGDGSGGGGELWTSNGTAAGTVMVRDINPGSGSSNPRNLTDVNGTLYFGADDGVTGFEVWKAVQNSTQAPIANPGGNYVIPVGSTLSLNGSASTDPDTDPITYSWDINGDGVYGDVLGALPVLSWTQLLAYGFADAPAQYNVSLRVTDPFGLQSTVATTVSVANTPPTVQLDGPSVVLRDQSANLLLLATDTSPSDQAAGFTFQVDWGDGSPAESFAGLSGLSATHAYLTVGARTIRVTATDQFGGISSPVTKIVNVSAVQLAPNADVPTWLDLIWTGSSGADTVVFEPLSGNGIRVRTVVENGVASGVSETFAGVTGRVIARGGAGNDTLDASALGTTKATLDGQAGNNRLLGGQAGDILIGGSNGAEGQQGSNTIIAGNGTNTIYGNDIIGLAGSTGGDNLIIGGSGNDTIYGSYRSVQKKDGTPSDGAEGGQNLIVSGGLTDTLYASQEFDGAEGGQGSILIAGTTSLDDVALSAVLDEWTSSRDYPTRILNILGLGAGPRANGERFLQPGVTVFNDAAIDFLVGDTTGSLNWFFPSLGQDIVIDAKPDETQTDIP